MNFEFYITIDFFLILSLALISISYSAIIHYNYSFLHLLLIYEIIFLSICLFFSTTGCIIDQIDGDIMVLFIIGVIAAETAIGISFYINTLMGNENIIYTNDKTFNKNKLINKEKNVIFYKTKTSIIYK
jgi:NADH:ubiquinone oxidoreductase subunit K